MAKHTLKISVNTAIFLKYVGQVNSSDKNTTKKFRQRLHNNIFVSWQDNKYNTREEKRDLKDSLVKTICGEVLMKLKTILGKSPKK